MISVDELENQSKYLIIRIDANEITYKNSSKMKTELNKTAFINNKCVELNMGQIEYIDSAGISVIIWMLKKMIEKKRGMRVLNLRKEVNDTFEKFGINILLKKAECVSE